jgi:mono/diheme cytochrome c family protein
MTNSHPQKCSRQLVPSMAVLSVVILTACRLSEKEQRADSGASSPAAARLQNDQAADSRAAFLDVYKVLMHPRCMNCHPAGDVPLQGDDSHLHLQNIQRGPDGKGLYALKCANCHQETNLRGENMPPGNPNWHLPPADAPMVFQGKSPAELARQLKDPKQNGGKALEQLLHHADDQLVLWGWDPGDGRTKPPLSHSEFAAKWREWIDKGAAIPE